LSAKVLKKAPAFPGPTQACSYATATCFRHKKTVHIFSPSLNNIKITSVIIAERALGFSNKYFNGHVIKNTDGGIRVINLNGV
jgi:hypothetical protein